MSNSKAKGRRTTLVRQISGFSGLPAYVAEFIGTFGLVFAGCGAIMIDALSHGQVTHVGVGLVFGLIIAAMIYATGHISGAHLNPAVTLGFVLARHFPIHRLAGYWLAQAAGATVAALCLRALFGAVAHLGATLPSGSGGAWQSFWLEALLTFFLMFVIMAVATDTRAVGQAAALAIGATVGLEALFAGPISGASMNPARSFGPALVSGTWTALWVYLIAPFIGAVLAALVYRWLRTASTVRVANTDLRGSMTTTDLNAGDARMAQTQDPDQAQSHQVAHERAEKTHEAPSPASGSQRVLFLCTHNSSRSQMAEGFLQVRGGDHYAAFSAGTHPRSVHPLAIRAMAELDIDIGETAGHYAKSLDTFQGQTFDLVVTVCDEAAEECPFFPGARRQEHWSFPDPSAVTGTEEERLDAFRQARDAIGARINEFLRNEA